MVGMVWNTRWIRNTFLFIVIIGNLYLGMSHSALSEGNSLSGQQAYLPHVGMILDTHKDVPAFTNPPSYFFGNLFNSEVDPLEKGKKFSVNEVLIYPGLGGNQIWLKVTPLDDSQCSNELKECWAIHGIEPKNEESPMDWNFNLNFHEVE